MSMQGAEKPKPEVEVAEEELQGVCGGVEAADEGLEAYDGVCVLSN